MRNLLTAFLSIALVGPLFQTPAVAENPEGPDYQVGGSQIDLHRRYPGDRPLDTGHVRDRGPESGPYVERCYWIARDTFLGLPWGFEQHCRRHTLDNTQ